MLNPSPFPGDQLIGQTPRLCPATYRAFHKQNKTYSNIKTTGLVCAKSLHFGHLEAPAQNQTHHNLHCKSTTLKMRRNRTFRYTYNCRCWPSSTVPVWKVYTKRQFRCTPWASQEGCLFYLSFSVWSSDLPLFYFCGLFLFCLLASTILDSFFLF